MTRRRPATPAIKEPAPPVTDQNDGDNEPTGIFVSDGSTAPSGLLGTECPSTPAPEAVRIFVTRQHGPNNTYEIVATEPEAPG